MKTPFLILALVASVATALAVDPPPDGGYPGTNTAEGEDALFSLTNGVNNTAIGFNALYKGANGNNNTGAGAYALYNNSNPIGYAGNDNTAVGAFALYANTRGPENTAIGYKALFSSTTTEGNTAIGSMALASTTTGSFNTATGWFALTNNTGGSNTATGNQALQENTTSYGNTANGAAALIENTTGRNNTASGLGALFNNTTGSSNVATGFNALYVNTGSDNVAIGYQAGAALTTGDNNIDIGNGGFAGESGRIRIGTEGTHTGTYIAGIRQAPLASGTALAVGIRADGQLGVRASSARFKDKIEPMAKASEAVLSLKPVTFSYKKELDPDAIPQFGLVAEDVAQVDPDLVAKDDQGKPYTVRYEAVNAMLLNEFLKEHKKVEEQAGEITELKSALKDMNARLTAKGL